MGKEGLRGSALLWHSSLLTGHSEQGGDGLREAAPRRCPKSKMWGPRQSARVGKCGQGVSFIRPTALLGWSPGIAVVRTTFLKWVLMFFTAGKYAIMGIFLLQIPEPPCPPKLPSHTAHFISL